MAGDAIAEIDASGHGISRAVGTIFQLAEEGAEPADAQAQQDGEYHEVAAAGRYDQTFFGKFYAQQATHDGFVG